MKPRLLFLLALPGALTACGGPPDVAILRLNNVGEERVENGVTTHVGPDAEHIRIHACQAQFTSDTFRTPEDVPPEGDKLPLGESLEFKLTPGCHDVYVGLYRVPVHRYHLEAGDFVVWDL